MLLALPKGIPTYQTAAGNWMQPDNVWRSNTPDDPILRCNVIPAIRPPLADHMPIITIINMPFPRATAARSLDFRQANWIKVNEDLAQRLESGPPPSRISLKEEFTTKVDELVLVIKGVLEDHLKERRPSPFKRRWWTKELSQLKKQQNRLSNKAYKFRHLRDHPIHTEYKAATNKFKDIMQETRNQDWSDWLEAASQQDLYIANKYITNEPTDYSNARVPSLRTTTKGVRFFSRAHICQVISSLSPYKAPGPDQIPNVVLMKCCDNIIDHLFYIFRAIIELNVYHPRWLESTTLVLRKIGKPSYDVAKAYCPIGLLDTILKVFSTLCARHISFLAEKHGLLPPTQIRRQTWQKHHRRNVIGYTQNQGCMEKRQICSRPLPRRSRHLPKHC